jgi:hypothetical protein
MAFDLRSGKMKAISCAICTIALFSPRQALAYDWVIEVNVLVIEPSYVPSLINFVVDGGAGSCPAGSWLAWNAQGADQPSKIANIQAVLAVLMTAKAGGTKVRLHGNNAGCSIEHIHAL